MNDGTEVKPQAWIDLANSIDPMWYANAGYLGEWEQRYPKLWMYAREFVQARFPSKPKAEHGASQAEGAD